MIRNLQAASLIILVTTLAACQPQSTTSEAALAPADAVAPSSPAQADAAPAAPQAATATVSAPDPRAFAGRFVAGSTTVELRGDGSFQLREADAGFDGTWTTEADGTRIRLDPGSKAEPDRLFSIGSVDEIHPVDAEGQPVPDGSPLRREGSR